MLKSASCGFGYLALQSLCQQATQAAAAHSAPDIGSATPLSDGAGLVGYPGPGATRSDEGATAALDRLAQLPEVDYYVCGVCGYTCESEPPEVCPVCQAKQKVFFLAD